MHLFWKKTGSSFSSLFLTFFSSVVTIYEKKIPFTHTKVSRPRLLDLWACSVTLWFLLIGKTNHNTWSLREDQEKVRILSSEAFHWRGIEKAGAVVSANHFAAFRKVPGDRNIMGHRSNSGCKPNLMSYLSLNSPF